jgi:hypothetical protein
VNNICLNQNKFVFRQPEVEFAGLLISSNSFVVHPNTVHAILDFPEPTTITEMRSFHGLVNQLVPYDPELAQKLHPLRHLLKKTPSFYMNEDDRRACSAAKDRIAAHTIAFFQPSQPIRVFCDAACTKSYGFVVKQLHDRHCGPSSLAAGF